MRKEEHDEDDGNAAMMCSSDLANLRGWDDCSHRRLAAESSKKKRPRQRLRSGQTYTFHKQMTRRPLLRAPQRSEWNEWESAYLTLRF
mmetsp:Transcript_2170/g.4587  ORF Transcript_2170/g.4587 Transcript_2170/m.4587 type:complete len:88 (+) Transcript_2170:93-356(+)